MACSGIGKRSHFVYVCVSACSSDIVMAGPVTTGKWRDMTESALVGADRWWKTSGYVLSRGRIVPAAASAITWYDPWEEYRNAQKVKGVSPPHEQFIRLCASLDVDFVALDAAYSGGAAVLDEYGFPSI